MRFRKEFSIRLVKFEVLLQPVDVQVLQTTIEQRIIYFGYPKMHLVSPLSEFIWRMGSGDNFPTIVSQRLHIANVKEAYQSTNKVKYIRQMLQHNDPSTVLDYMEETMSYVAVQGWYDIDSAKVFNLLSAANKQQNTSSAHLIHLQHCQEEPFFHSVSHPANHLRETQVRGVWRSIKLTSLRDASVDIGICNFGQLFGIQIEEDCGHEASGLVLGYDQNVLIDNIFIEL